MGYTEYSKGGEKMKGELKKFREMCQISQVEAGKLLGINAKVLSRYERGTNAPRGQRRDNILKEIEKYIKRAEIFEDDLKAFRKENKFSMQYIADMLGTTKSAISFYEKHKFHPRPEKLPFYEEILKTQRRKLKEE